MVAKKKTQLKAKNKLKISKLQALVLIAVVAIAGAVIISLTHASGKIGNDGCPIPYNITLARGSKGNCVRTMQWYLNATTSAGLVQDGSYGAKTETAVRNFQKFFKMPVTGKIDRKTYDTIRFINQVNCNNNKPNCVGAG